MAGQNDQQERAALEDGAARPVSAEAFARMMDALGPFERSPRLAVAVSGGADSLALTLLAHAWATERNGSVLAITVDHGLRPAASEEARSVGAWLAARGISHVVLTGQGPRPVANVQAVARDLRYGLLLNRCKADGILHLLTGHHRDDQAETLLLRLGRGSGVHGLAAMAPVSEVAECRILRPLLSVGRADLAATCREAGQDWIDDPSNADPRHARVRARATLPVLEMAGIGLSSARLADTAVRLGRAREAEDESVATLLSASVEVDPLGYARIWPDLFANAPEEIALRALARVLACIGGASHTPRLANLERSLSRLGQDTLTVAGCRIAYRRGRWTVCREAARAAAPVVVSAGAWDGRWRWTPNPSAGTGLSVGALGEAGLENIPKVVRQGHSAVVVEALPAVFKGPEIVGLPALQWWKSHEPLPAMVLESLWFAPRVAMTYVGTGGLRRWRRHLCRQVDSFRVAERRSQAGSGHRPRRAT